MLQDFLLEPIEYFRKPILLQKQLSLKFVLMLQMDHAYFVKSNFIALFQQVNHGIYEESNGVICYYSNDLLHRCLHFYTVCTIFRCLFQRVAHRTSKYFA
jgi:phosphoglycerate-specific signal transduction histidine kinase